MTALTFLHQASMEFLIDYGLGVTAIDRNFPEIGSRERWREFEELREWGIARIKGLVAEFGATA